MIRYKEIAFVAYPVTRVARARKFYEGVLGLKSNGYGSGKYAKWIEYDIGSGTFGIGSSAMWKPSRTGALVALEFLDFEAAVAQLKKKRIKFVIGPEWAFVPDGHRPGSRRQADHPASSKMAGGTVTQKGTGSHTVPIRSLQSAPHHHREKHH